jgi:GNAT superfamily N-acetyltransferase
VLPWDSGFFGVTIGRATVQTVEDVRAACKEATGSGVKCLYLFVPCATPSVVTAAVQAGGLLADIRMELDLRRPAGPIRRTPPVDVSELEEPCRLLAATSRFRTDPRFPAGKVEEMYRIWLGNCARDGVVVAGDPAGSGFVGAVRDGDETRVALVYVADGARGLGLGVRLIGEALDALPAPVACVVTQAGNVAALRLYQGLGFKTRSLTAILHVWLSGL